MRTFNNEQEQVDFLKELWETYGRVILVGLAVGLVAMYGLRFWQSSHQRQSEVASTLYEQVLKSFKNDQSEILASQVEKMKTEYKKTPYAPLAALVQARALVEASEFDKAGEQYQWVMDNARDDDAKQIARIRLARVQLAKGDIDKGLGLLDTESSDTFNVYADEVRGDLYFAKGDKARAKQAYQAALALAGNQPIRNILEMKLANLA